MRAKKQSRFSEGTVYSVIHLQGRTGHSNQNNFRTTSKRSYLPFKSEQTFNRSMGGKSFVIIKNIVLLQSKLTCRFWKGLISHFYANLAYNFGSELML